MRVLTEHQEDCVEQDLRCGTDVIMIQRVCDTGCCYFDEGLPDFLISSADRCAFKLFRTSDTRLEDTSRRLS